MYIYLITDHVSRRYTRWNLAYGTHSRLYALPVHVIMPKKNFIRAYIYQHWRYLNCDISLTYRSLETRNQLFITRLVRIMAGLSLPVYLLTLVKRKTNSSSRRIPLVRVIRVCNLPYSAYGNAVFISLTIALDVDQSLCT